MVGKNRDSSREAFWRRMLRRRAKSGMTIAEFCASEAVTVSAFYYWQRQIRRRDVAAEAENSDSTGEPTFLPVQILDDQVAAAPVEIVVGDGYVIRVSEAATIDHVRRVLQAVGTVDGGRR